MQGQDIQRGLRFAVGELAMVDQTKVNVDLAEYTPQSGSQWDGGHLGGSGKEISSRCTLVFWLTQTNYTASR